MNLLAFHTKPISTKTDASAVIKEVPFEEVCAYILDGSDSKVSTLLAGIWSLRESLGKEKILKAIVCTIFPNKGYMRPASSCRAVLFAKESSCLQEFQKVIKERWALIFERQSIELTLGLSAGGCFADWSPVVVDLFDLNTSNDVRTQLVKAINNIFKTSKSAEAEKLLNAFLGKMPLEINAYTNPNNFHFIVQLANNSR